MLINLLRHEDHDKLTESFAIDVLKGFHDKPKHLSSKYFYDDEGSRIFSEITQLPEYYLTSCERDIFVKKRHLIADAIPSGPFSLIELGAGDGQKTQLLIETFLEKQREFEFIAIDISKHAIHDLYDTFSSRFNALSQTGLVASYSEGIDWIKANKKGRNVVLFLGSTIGNFNESEAITFLRILWRHLNHGDLFLIAFDLKKDIALLNKAYNDEKGITAKFNLNILRRINRELGGNFDLEQYMHHGIYNPVIGAMESYLIARTSQTVHIKELASNFHFNAFEPIHLEYSKKYLPEDIAHYARESGFIVLHNYTDDQNFFTSSLWQVNKSTDA